MKKTLLSLAIFLILLSGVYFLSANSIATSSSYNEVMNSRFPAELFFTGERAEMGQAIYKNDVKTVKKLIDKGIDVNRLSEQKDGFTYLTYAVFLKDRFEIVKLLLSAKADPNILTKVYFTNYHSPQVNVPNIKGERYFLPLSIAAGSRSIEYLELLLKAGADPNNYRNDVDYGKTRAALILAASSDYWEGEYNKKWIEEDIKKRIDLLLKYGADINARDKVGNTALDAAFNGEFLNVANYLLDKGINPNLSKNLIFKLKFEITPEMLNTRSKETRQEYYESIVKLLKRLGHDQVE